MSDLISRSKLLKEIETWGGCVEALHEYIEKMPTAYDIDKVVEELEKELSLADKEKKRCSKENHLQFDSAKGYASGISTAIEIVKQGGVADDCCEWKQSESFMSIRTYNIGCCDRTLDLTVRMSEEMKYCPYCGKKIKVVE